MLGSGVTKSNWNKLTFFVNCFLLVSNSLPPTVQQGESNARGLALIALDFHGDVAHGYLFCVPNVTAAVPNQRGTPSQPHNLGIAYPPQFSKGNRMHVVSH